MYTLNYAVNEAKSVTALRYPRGGVGRSFDNGAFVVGRAAVVKSGTDLTIAAYGSMVSRAMDCAEEMEKRGISAEVIDLRTVKPIDTATVTRSAAKTGRLVFMEEVVRCGGIGEQLIANLRLRGMDLPVKLISLPDDFVPHAAMDELIEHYGFTTQQLIKSMEEIL